MADYHIEIFFEKPKLTTDQQKPFSLHLNLIDLVSLAKIHLDNLKISNDRRDRRKYTMRPAHYASKCILSSSSSRCADPFTPSIPLRKSSRQHLVSVQGRWIHIFAGQPLLVSQWENITNEFLLTSSAVHSMSCLCYLDNLWDGR